LQERMKFSPNLPTPQPCHTYRTLHSSCRSSVTLSDKHTRKQQNARCRALGLIVCAVSVAFASLRRQSVHGKLTVASSRKISPKSISMHRRNTSRLRLITQRMMRTMLVSRENRMRRANNMIVQYVFRVPALRLPRAVRWWYYSEVFAVRPGYVGRIRAVDEEHLGIRPRQSARRGSEGARDYSTCPRHQADGIGFVYS
jgi:hypothetical protein